MGSFASRRRPETPRKDARPAEPPARRFGRIGDGGGDDQTDGSVDAMATIRKGEGGWHLEISFASGVSIVWDEPFQTQQDAIRMLDQFCEETSAVEIQMH